MWPEHDRRTWLAAQHGTGPAGLDNPAANWSKRTVKKNEDGYGRYLLAAPCGLFVEAERVVDRITPDRLASYGAYLKSVVSPASVGAFVGALASAARALEPDANWSWLGRRSSRLKLKGKPSREKRHAMRHTLEAVRIWQERDGHRGPAQAREHSCGLSATRRGSSSRCWRPGPCGSGTSRPSPSARPCGGTDSATG